MRYIFIIFVGLILSCTIGAPIGEPSVDIISSPGEGETVYNEIVNISWKGNENAVEFNFSMDEKWYGWGKDSSWTFILDEGPHTFKLISRNELGEEQKDTISLHFSVDAIREPAFWIKSRYTETFRDSLFSIAVMGENIPTFSIGYFVIKWNPSYILMQQDYPDSILINKGNYIYISDKGMDSLIVYIGVANDSMIGNFPLFHIEFLSVDEGMDTVKIDTMDVRNIRNHPLTIKTHPIGGIVDIK